MAMQREDGQDYSRRVERESFVKYIREMAKEEPERYGELTRYINPEYDSWTELKEIFQNRALTEQKYYWWDQTRIDSAQWDNESTCGFSHWYEVMELYESMQALPFDLQDEDFVSIFGFGEFQAFADLSYGC